jgi:16S rRNA (guanine1207-N2)-methyltransferase
MENTTRLLQRHQTSLSSRHVLVVGADDLGLNELTTASLRLHSDDTSLLAGQAAMLPVIDKTTDLLVIILPKSREQLAFWLASLAGQISAPMELWLVGASSGGVRGGVTTLKTFSNDVVQRDSARHCKLFVTQLQPADFSQNAFEKTWRCDVFPAGAGVTPFEVSSYPGVFSHGRADPGTDLLLQTLAPLSMRGSALDVGCGAGVISVALAQKGCAVTAVDVSATAVFAATQTLEKNRQAASVFCSDVFNQVEGRFDQIVTNPPFHDGTRRTTAVTQRLIEQAPQYLAGRGVLWLVANQGLPYGDWLRGAFKSVEVAAENNRFRVWRAQR